MFYEMILFCSPDRVVGGIISLVEINTEKKEHFTGERGPMSERAALPSSGNGSWRPMQLWLQTLHMSWDWALPYG